MHTFLNFTGIKKYVVGLIIKTSSDPVNVEVSWPLLSTIVLYVVLFCIACSQTYWNV